MLRVKTKIKNSDISGIGLYADQFIPKGTVTWQYDADIEPSFTLEKFSSFSEYVKEHILIHGYYDHSISRYILCVDNQAFINHSSNPNIDSTPDADVASRDIQPGEELTCNYRQYEPDWFERRANYNWSHFG